MSDKKCPHCSHPNPGMAIRCAKCGKPLRSSLATASQPPSQAYYLVGTMGVFDLSGRKEWVIGNVGADIVLNDATVAPRHALLSQRGNSWVVKSLEERVLVGNVLLQDEERLVPEDILVLGRVSLKFQDNPIIAAPAAAPSTHKPAPPMPPSHPTPPPKPKPPMPSRSSASSSAGASPAPTSRPAPVPVPPVPPTSYSGTGSTTAASYSSAPVPVPARPPMPTPPTPTPSPFSGAAGSPSPMPTTSVMPLPPAFARLRRPEIAGVVTSIGGPIVMTVSPWSGTLLKVIVGILLFMFRPIFVILWMVTGQNNEKHQNVYFYRVEIAPGMLREARQERDLIGAGISMGDYVSFWCWSKSGTLVMERAFNHTTGGEVKFAASWEWIQQGFVLLVGSGILFMCGLCMLSVVLS